MTERNGHCLCGNIHFTAELESEDYGACHCGMCLRWAGGPLVEAQASAVTFTAGEPKEYRSSEWAARLFCPDCGTHLAYRTLDGSFYGVGAGLFDPPLTGKMAMEVFIDEKPEGYAFEGDHQRLTGAELMAMMGKPE